MGNLLLETKDLIIGYLSKKNAKSVAGPINISVNAGKMICLLGSNGSGKSTLLRTVAGLQVPISGQVLLNGMSIKDLKVSYIAEKISLVLSEKNIGNSMDVYSLIALGRYPYNGLLGILNEDDKRIIKLAASLTDTTRFMSRKVDSLSDGEFQKVMLARALAQDTPIIILDEPTAHLDLPSRLKLMQLLYQLARDTGKAILISTHELDLALQTADCIWLMDGEILHTGLPEELVLSGVFQHVFNHNELEFNPQTGQFKIEKLVTNYVALKGDGLVYIWTKKALERRGFGIVDEQNSHVTINVGVRGNGFFWELKVQGNPDIIYHNLFQLISEIDDLYVRE